jgi:hypothetical protein
MSHIRNAGEILLGPHTPFTLGNFVIGPNAVLPTSGAARTVSPLSVLDYVKRSSIAYVTAAATRSWRPRPRPWPATRASTAMPTRSQIGGGRVKIRRCVNVSGV